MCFYLSFSTYHTRNGFIDQSGSARPISTHDPAEGHLPMQVAGYLPRVDTAG